MTDLIAAHREELAALTQRIGEQNAVINRRDKDRLLDEDLLRQSMDQIEALEFELGKALGDEPGTNVVVLLIRERLQDNPNGRATQPRAGDDR